MKFDYRRSTKQDLVKICKNFTLNFFTEIRFKVIRNCGSNENKKANLFFDRSCIAYILSFRNGSILHLQH